MAWKLMLVSAATSLPEHLWISTDTITFKEVTAKLNFLSRGK